MMCATLYNSSSATWSSRRGRVTCNSASVFAARPSWIQERIASDSSVNGSPFMPSCCSGSSQGNHKRQEGIRVIANRRADKSAKCVKRSTPRVSGPVSAMFGSDRWSSDMIYRGRLLAGV